MRTGTLVGEAALLAAGALKGGALATRLPHATKILTHGKKILPSLKNVRLAGRYLFKSKAPSSWGAKAAKIFGSTSAALAPSVS